MSEIITTLGSILLIGLEILGIILLVTFIGTIIFSIVDEIWWHLPGKDDTLEDTRKKSEQKEGQKDE